MTPTTLFPDEDLPIEPAADRVEPTVWVRRLVVVAERMPTAPVVREVSFRPGLNVIRVEERPAGETRPIGHSVGKTLLARLLRYCLGESHFAVPAVVNRIADRLPGAYVLAEVAVAGQWWAVARPLRGAPVTESWAAPADDWRAGLGDASGLQRYGDFLDALTQATVAPLPELRLPGANHVARWLDLLAWLARDQECSYQHPNEWRDTYAGSGTAQLHSDDASLLMRWAMGLLNTREIEELTHRQGLLRDQGEAKRAVERFTRQIESTRPALFRRLSLQEEEPAGDLFARRAGETVDGQIQSLQRLLAEFTEDAQVEQLREEVVRAAQAVAVAEDRLTRLRGLRQATEGELRQRRESSGDKYYAVFDPHRTCPLARADCPYHPANRTAGVTDPEREHRIAELEAVLARQDQELAVLAEQVPAWCQERRQVEARYAREHRSRQQNIAGTLAQIGRWELLSEELREYEEARRSRDEAQGRVDALDRQVRESRERQEAARGERARRHRRLCDCFDWALKRLLGPEAGGTVRLDARGLHPAPDHSVAPNGAAIATLATVLGHDLACLAATVCGVGHLPGFLLHDSPKGVDMEPALYERIFLLALELERTFGQRRPSFQYIVTTTTPPPAEVAGEYTRMILDARDESGLLLKVRF